MIRDTVYKQQFEDDLARREGRPDHAKSLKIFTQLWDEGRAKGGLPPVDPMDGIETDVRVARILNSCSRT